MSGGWRTRSAILVGGAILLGLALRTYHYLRDPVVWHDEAALIVNVLALDFVELLGPLRHAEAAPPLFLWLERATALLLGDGTLALRLPPFLASIAALALIAWTAWREMGPAAAAWAVFLIACSDRLLWHACEAKPYALDVLCATVLLALFSATREWRIGRRAWAFVPLMPLIVWVSYPGCFLCGGLLLALLPEIWRDRRPASLIAFGMLGLAVVGSFALLYYGPARAQRCGAMDSCWTGQFPDWGRPWTVPIWSLASTLDVARYCFMPWGYPLAALAAIGGIRLCRTGCGDFVTIAAAPLGLNLLAALLHDYPYGGARVVVHAAPAMAFLSAAGIGPCLDWLRVRARPAAFAATAVLLMPLGLSLYHVAVPWFRADSAAAAAYALDRRTADEPVFGNHWEYEYYCRGIGDHFQYLPPDLPQSDGRLWVVYTAFEARDRAAELDVLTRGRIVLDRREYIGASVILLGPMPPATQSTAAK